MASSSGKRVEDIVEGEDDQAQQSNESEDEVQDPSSSGQPSTSSQPQASGSGSSSKKKKKKKGKAVQAINNVLASASGSKDISDKLVAHVTEQVKADNPNNEEVRQISEEEVRKALQILKAVDVMQGKTGLGGKNAKDMGEYKFWKTQPVPQLGEGSPEEDGPIEPSKPRDQVRQEPYPLPKDFEWSTIDINDQGQIREVYELLSQNYVEDDNAAFRFQYSAEFFEWALKPPGYHKEWHIGVRAMPKKKLIGFISGVPIRLRVRENFLDAVEINYLCVHKKLRSKRLAPVLIKEVTRQCHLLGIFQAIYTAGVVLPTPVSVCRYYHRSLNIPKLVDVQFTYVPRNSTLARMVKLNALPENLSIPEIREMEDRDVDGVWDLLTRYMTRFKMSVAYTKEEVRHNFYSGRGVEGALLENARREKQVVWTYVVSDPSTNEITDFFSFYSLPSTIMKSQKHSLLEAAYMYYYATDVAFQHGAETDGRLKNRLMDLIGDALIIANKMKFDVVNAMTLMDNDLVLRDLKFGQGDGYLNYYLYNWRTSKLEGMQALPESEGGGQGVGRGIGVVML
ncbi:glycylpeptide N-tetradecanoyltransferase [Tulasnella sp. 418]|nr:glycylpeptide N-tetradecanoyltransferase [Tulasnella sp. 418]